MPYKFGPGDLVQRSQLGDVGNGGDGIERSLLWLGLHKSQMTNFYMMAQNIHGSLV